MPGCGRNTVESTGLTGLGIQPAFSALRGLSSGRGGTLLCRGKHKTCSKDTNIQSKEQSLGITQRHLLYSPREFRVCAIFHPPFRVCPPNTDTSSSFLIHTTGMGHRPGPLATTKVLYSLQLSEDGHLKSLGTFENLGSGGS